MAINDYTPEQRAALDYFMPYVNHAVRKVSDAPGGGYYITAFIVRDDMENPVLLHVGNVPNKGEDLVLIHYQLACSAALIDSTDAVQRTEIKLAPNTQTPEEIADKLAVALLSMPVGDESDDVRDLVTEYLKSRKK